MDIILTIWHGYQAIAVIFTTFFLFGLIKNLKQAKDEQTAGEVKKALNTVKLVQIEVVDNTAMMFDSVTKTFLCQATSTEELWEVAKNRYPNYKFLEVDLDKLEK